jgi:hypothetical protein
MVRPSTSSTRRRHLLTPDNRADQAGRSSIGPISMPLNDELLLAS